MTQLLDTNVLVRHVSGSPVEQARAATGFLKAADRGALLLTDVHVAEFVWVLQSSLYKADRQTIRAALEAILALPAIAVANPGLLHDAIDIYAQRSMNWTGAYLIASARAIKATEVVSFDQFDAKLSGLGMRRVEPPRTFSG
ncbi:MAG: type II toxin-antitoxin system VapC family toxin [Chloroflexi bacterium]|nr:MAG: type II toxin-antitoxin system VapC family toxin [Chloroflexota bacterium]